MAVSPQAFEIGLSEPLDDGSLAGLVATLTPNGGVAQTLTASLTTDRRGLVLSGSTVPPGQSCTLHLEGLTDPTGNALLPIHQPVTLADVQAYAVLADTAPPRLTAVIDTTDGLLLAFDEPVIAAPGFQLAAAVTITRSGLPLDGTTTRVAPNLLHWSPTSGGAGSAWQLGSEVRLTDVHVTDTSAEAKPLAGALLPLTVTHLATSEATPLVAYSAPTDSHPRASSAYGLTTLFQGRTWHPDLGMYHYRARWYDPTLANFVERDPAGYQDSPSRYQGMGFNGPNVLDPSGKWDVAFHWYVIYYLASLAMTDQGSIERIAWASQYVDDDPVTRPISADPWVLAFHFADSTGEGTAYGRENHLATRALGVALDSLNDFRVGIALHTFADTFSHAGFTWRPGAAANQRRTGPAVIPAIGHLQFYTEPDDLKGRFSVGADAAVECYRALHEYATRLGVARSDVDEASLRSSLEIAFAVLPDSETSWGVTLQAVFEASGVSVPSGRRAYYSPQLLEYRRARSAHGALLWEAIGPRWLEEQERPIRAFREVTPGWYR